ncbi:hypothetical protein BZM26_05020 [Paraburkholderia strydomiana]|nr:hypothetical protein BZM26_05020 [Paraburkholderia strydomiana]
MLPNTILDLPEATQKEPPMTETPTPQKPDPQQSETGRGTPPARTPEALPETDVQPDQQPVRDIPGVGVPGSQSPAP